jgi:hypothetical protein
MCIADCLSAPQVQAGDFTLSIFEVEQVGVEHDGFSAQLQQGAGLVARQDPGLILHKE